mgnify:CR=1 FL=1
MKMEEGEVILRDFEGLNIDIPTNREIVRDHYKQNLKERMVKQEKYDDDKLLADLQQPNR